MEDIDDNNLKLKESLDFVIWCYKCIYSVIQKIRTISIFSEIKTSH